MEKRFDVRTDRWQWKIRKTGYKMISRNVRNCEDELVQHLNWCNILPAIQNIVQ
jgi:hypothetical protein